MSKICSFGRFNKKHLLILLSIPFNIPLYFLIKYSQLLSEDNKHPIIYVICRSLGLCLSFISLIISKNVNKTGKANNKISINEMKIAGKKQIKQISKRNKFIWILLISTIDFIAINLYSIFWTDILNYGNTWAFDIVSLNTFSVLILKNKLYKHHILSFLIIIIISILYYVYYLLYLYQSEYLLNNLMNYLSRILLSLTYIFYKYFMLIKYIDKFETLLYEGIIELVLGIIELIITTNIGYLDDFYGFIKNANGIQILFIILIIIFEFLYNSLKIIVNDYFSPHFVFLLNLISEMPTILFCWALEKLNIIFSIFSTLIGFVYTFALFIYTEIIEINYCGLSRMTEKNIHLRAKNESLSMNDDTENENNLITYRGYSIELRDKRQEMLLSSEDDSSENLN